MNACFLLLEGVALKFGEQYYYGHVERKNTNDNYNMAESCYIIKSGVLGGGAALSMFTCGLSMVYYVMATSLDVHGTQHNTNNNSNNKSIINGIYMYIHIWYTVYGMVYIHTYTYDTLTYIV